MGSMLYFDQDSVTFAQMELMMQILGHQKADLYLKSNPEIKMTFDEVEALAMKYRDKMLEALYTQFGYIPQINPGSK